jgi:hypothetical protein
LVDLNAPLLEFRVEAILQVGLAKPPVLVVAIFGEDLPNVVPFYIFTAVSKGPWLQYVLLASEGQLFQISKDMQPLPLNGAPPFPMLVSIFFTKFCFGLLALAVHGFLNLLPMGSLKNFIIFIKRRIQYIYNLGSPTEHAYKLQTLESRCNVVRCGASVCERMLDPTRVPRNELQV